jgi:MFS family permease
LNIAPAKLAAQWFGKNERVIAITIALTFNPIGVATGYVLPAFWVGKADTEAANAAQARLDIKASLIFQALIGSAIFLLVLLGMRDKPPTPPSSTKSTKATSLKQDIAVVLKNKNFVLLMIVFALVMGMMNTYGTVIGILTAALNYGPTAASAFGAFFIIGGIVGSAVFGVIVEIKKIYKFATIVICGLSSVMSVVLMFVLLTNDLTSVSIACFITGFSLVPILPVCMDFGVELTHPIPEPVSSGLQMSAGALIGIIQTIAASVSITVEEKNSHPTMGCNIAQAVLIVSGWAAFIMSFCIKEDLRRIKEAKEKET